MITQIPESVIGYLFMALTSIILWEFYKFQFESNQQTKT